MTKTSAKHTVGADKSKTGGKKAGQTKGQNERDPKGRNGQYTAAGDAPIMKK